jgi:hypothetical protein
MAGQNCGVPVVFVQVKSAVQVGHCALAEKIATKNAAKKTYMFFIGKGRI